MFSSVRTGLSEELKELDSKGLYKRERIIITPQSALLIERRLENTFILIYFHTG